jgi:TonB family protein
MRIRGFLPLILFVALLLSILPSIFGQTNEPAVVLQLLQPASEDFSVDMPKDPVFETGKFPYHKMELNTHLYLSGTAPGPVFAIVTLSGIKSNPALYSEEQRVNSYVDAFKKFFAPRIKGKDAVAKLTFTATSMLNGNPGREYDITIGDLSGKARVYGTRKRFYAAVFLAAAKSEKLRDQFLSSFIIPDYVPPTTSPVVTAQAPGKTEVPSPAENTAAASTNTAAADQEKDQQKTDADPGQTGKADPAKTNSASETKGAESHKENIPPSKGPISGGVLNGKALSLPKPDYPPEARAAKASGTVAVQVTIDEYGTVIAANAVSGHPLLQQSCIYAAYQARFSPTLMMGEPVKVTGVITYNFVAQ